MNKDTAAFVASKRKRKSPIKKQVEAPPKIPKDLQDQWGSVVAVADTVNLMQKASIPYTTMRIMENLIPFWMKLYEQCVEQASKHPQANLIPELKNIMEKKNGQTGTTT